MTHLIKRTPNLDEAMLKKMVNDHVREKDMHAAHMKLVEAKKADPYPAPIAHHDIEAAVRQKADGTHVADYVVVDHLPLAPGDHAGLRARLDELRHQVRQMEQAAIHALLPLGKWRLAGLLYQAAKNAVKPSADQKALIDEHEDRMKRLSDIHVHHAALEAEIEDLDYISVATWRPRPYQEAKS